MKAWLDGIPITGSGLKKTLQYPVFVLRRQDETGEKAFSFTGDLTFTGKEYTYLYLMLKTDPNAKTNKVVMRFENDCCTTPQVYEFYITAKGLKWCEGHCTMTAVAVEKSQSSDQLICLKNTLIWDNYAGFQSKQHPRFSYCNELRPNWMHDIMIIFFVLSATMLLVLAPMIAGIVLTFNIINNILSWLNSNLNTSFSLLSFGGQTNLDFNDMQNYFNLMTSFIVGCGRKHPSPLARDYADNVCGKCGLTFQSSIFKNGASPYYNSCYFNAPINKGTLETDTTTFWIDENKPLRNGVQFFNELISIVNGRWEINSNVLTLERQDYFVPKAPFLDLTTFPGVVKICWQHSTKERYAYATFDYQKDAVNWVGGEARERWGDIVEWNPTGSTTQKGEFLPLFPFTSCRFRDDGIDRDVLSAYRNFPTIGPMIKKYDNAIIMNSHTCYAPMLLIWDTGSPIDNAKVQRGYSGAPINSTQTYNYPYWFDANYSGNLYDNFWYIENPNYSGFVGLEFTAEVEYDCDLLTNLDLDGVIKTIEGDGRITEITVNFEQRKLFITGTV